MKKPRAKLGLIVPSMNVVVEQELHELAPRGVLILAARARNFFEGASPEETLMRMDEEYVPQAAKELSDAEVNIIGFACTSGSFLKGTSYDKQLSKTIHDVSGIPAITTTEAVVKALKKLKVRRLSVATPYTRSLDATLRLLLEENGFEVLKIRGLEDEGVRVPGSNYGVREIGMDRSQYKMAKKVFAEETDCVFLSCTNWSSNWCINRLERELGRPVISSNTATLWLMLRESGIDDAIHGYGKILEL